MVFVWVIASTFLVSLISLVGVCTLAIKGNLLNKVLFTLIGFSAGALIGGAFLHILPESLERMGNYPVFNCTIMGFVLFFLMERYFYWRHCHEADCHVHAFTYMNLIGEGMHNFMDGMAIAVSFVVSIKIGVVTTVAIILHEIPKELGNFGVLIYGGFTRKKALLYNFMCGLMAMVGAVTGYLISEIAQGFVGFIMPLTAGGFIYIAASDLVPEIHKEKDNKRATLALLAFLLGIVFMALSRLIFKE